MLTTKSDRRCDCEPFWMEIEMFWMCKSRRESASEEEQEKSVCRESCMCRLLRPKGKFLLIRSSESDKMSKLTKRSTGQLFSSANRSGSARIWRFQIRSSWRVFALQLRRSQNTFWLMTPPKSRSTVNDRPRRDGKRAKRLLQSVKFKVEILERSTDSKACMLDRIIDRERTLLGR